MGAEQSTVRSDRVTERSGHSNEVSSRTKSPAVRSVPEPQSTPSQQRQCMANEASNKQGSTDYAFEKQNDNFKAGSWKCNQFVEHNQKSCNVNPPKANSYFGIEGRSPATANQWADPHATNMPQWKTVTDGSLMPGDVVAKSGGPGSHGHMGQVGASGEIIAAGKHEVHSRPEHYLNPKTDPGITVKRFVGKNGK